MAYREDEEKRIYELETAESLSAGTFVPVDKEGNEMAEKFDLGTALNKKVDAPSTAPEAGQVLTFDGTENTWANPPEGVYVINYSEVTDLDDIDTEKATTIPTFILIDSDQTLTIGNSTSSDTISINSGTIMRLEEVGGNDNGKPVFLTFVNDYGKSSTGGTYMTYGNYFVRLVVSKSMYGGVSKQFGVSADIWSSNLFRSQQIPVVKKYDIARGPSESSGNLNGDANSLIVSFEDAGSNKRRQLLPPAELASHDFSSDTTPEQIQFMGWGATSNRAGYKNMLTASHGFDSTNYPTQTPMVNFTRYVMVADPTSNYDANQVQMSAGVTVKSSDGQNTQIWSGNFVPTPGANQGYLKYWTDTNGGHMDWTSVSEVPASTAQDEGKVLTVDSNGAPVWGQSGSTKEIYDIRGIVYSRYGGSGPIASIVIDKSYDEVLAAFNSGKDMRLTIRAKLLGANESISSSDVAPYFAEDNHIEQTLWLSRDYQATIPGTSELGTAFTFVPKSIYDISEVSGTSRHQIQPGTDFVYAYYGTTYEYNICSSDILVQIFTYNSVLLSYNSTYHKLSMYISDATQIGIDIPLSVTWDQFALSFIAYSGDHNFPEIVRQWDAINISELVFRVCEVHMAESVETDNYFKFSAQENSGTSYITIFPKDVDGVLQTYWKYVQA